MKRLVIHCGLHKTGSTALQTWLSEQAGNLHAQKMLYPQTGTVVDAGGGHHNIAWQIAGDRRFDPQAGKLATLIQEIAAFDGTVILSSEDFETMLGTKPKVARLLAAFAPCGTHPEFVIYLRNQLDYYESLFFENLGQGSAKSYAESIGDIFHNGRFRLKDWVFQFDYRRMLDIMRAAGATVIVRNFHALDGGSVISDFGNLIGAGAAAINAETAGAPSRRPELRGAIAMFYGNRMALPMAPEEQNCARMIAEEIGARTIRTSETGRRRFRDMFQADNKTVCAEAGVPATRLDYQDARTGGDDIPDAFCYERIFSDRTCELLRNMRDVLPPSGPPAAIELARRYFRPERGAAPIWGVPPAPAH